MDCFISLTTFAPSASSEDEPLEQVDYEGQGHGARYYCIIA